MKKIVIGVDIGGTNTAIGFVNQEGEIVALGNMETPKSGSFENYIALITDKIMELSQPDMIISGIGIGAPNGCYHTGRIEYAANLYWSDSLPIVEMLEKRFSGIPIILTNDANAATIGEMVYGDAKGLKNFAMITLGTGVGSGFVANGELIYGFDGFAGEAGHIVVDENGRSCGCGRRGCLETYTSATGIVRTAHEILAECKTESSLRNIRRDCLTGLDITQAARNGDSVALECFNRTGRILGRTLANIVTITAPEKIFIFGGLSQAGFLIFEPIRKAFEESILSTWRNKIEIVPSGLQGKNIAILGAASLVRD
ncbi:MAG: ROK family protein [Rikenellaceae bacterium]